MYICIYIMVDGKWYILRARTHLRFFLDSALSCLAARQVSSSCFTRIEGNICRVFHVFLVYTFRVCHSYIIFFHDMLKYIYIYITICRQSSRPNIPPENQSMVGALEHNWMIFHIGNVIIPTDELTPWLFRGVGLKPQPVLLLTIIHHIISIIINHY